MRNSSPSCFVVVAAAAHFYYNNVSVYEGDRIITRVTIQVIIISACFFNGTFGTTRACIAHYKYSDNECLSFGVLKATI